MQQAGQGDSLNAMRNAQTALDILSRGDEERAAQIKLCSFCLHRDAKGKRKTKRKEDPCSVCGKAVDWEKYDFDPATTEGEILGFIANLNVLETLRRKRKVIQ